MASKKKKMLERNGLPLWGWTVGAVLVTAVIFLGYRTVQSELDSAKEEAVRAKSGAAELEQVAENLRLKLEDAERELQRLNEAADRAKAEASEREKQIAMLRQGRVSCEEFFEEWGVRASPPSILPQQRIASIKAMSPRLADTGKACSFKLKRSDHR
jgi:chromosome segregation ATPase